MQQSFFRVVAILAIFLYAAVFLVGCSKNTTAPPPDQRNETPAMKQQRKSKEG
jgi:hypothetical protein